MQNSDIAQKRKAASKAAFEALISSSEDENDDDYDNLHSCSKGELVDMVRSLRKKLEKAGLKCDLNKGKHYHQSKLGRADFSSQPGTVFNPVHTAIAVALVYFRQAYQYCYCLYFRIARNAH